jgi:NADPH:quinone reductase-like Zn-dependent oxidoreductase
MRDDNSNPKTIPPTMWALQLRAYDGKPESLVLAEKPVPRPGKGQVLVKIAAAPMNPSDTGFIRGLYAMQKKLPVTPGFEGSGTVVASGGGFMANVLVGKRVACSAPFDGDGTWAEYMVTAAKMCIPLRKHVSLEQGAMLIVNPMTAWALLDIAKRGGHRVVVQSAAASALGRMLFRLGQRLGITIINIVRRQEQVDLLQALGANYVLNSSTPDFEELLRQLSYRLHVSLALEAVSGEIAGYILRALPKGAKMIVYGAISEQACQIDPRSLIFEGKRLEGFWLAEWARRKSMFGQIRAAMQVQKYLASDLKTEVRARLPLEEAMKGLQQYVAGMTEGKILLFPHGSKTHTE